jgi:CheY-like chemotaxis protein
MRIDSCISGNEALKLVESNKYDLVLMDHMMPGMDGIETTQAIRALPGEYFQKLPIVVLTANAISGMRDMFLESGFNDYISKPVEIIKLDDIIARWIPGEKQIKAGTLIRRERLGGEPEIRIPGVDTQRGIDMTGGTETGYRRVLAQFYKDALERLPVFAAPPGETADGDNGRFSVFTAQAHAIKSAAGTIGAAEVSAEAAVLEAAGKAGDMETIRKTLPGFHERLTRLIEAIGKVPKGNAAPRSESSFSVLYSPLAALKQALEAKNMKEIDRLLAELEQAADEETREWINAISDKILMGEYGEAAGCIDDLIKGSHHES